MLARMYILLWTEYSVDTNTYLMLYLPGNQSVS